LKAIINNIPAFDVTEGTTGSFITNTYITGFDLYITDKLGNPIHDNGDTWYEATSTNEFTIFGNSGLENGKEYLLYVVTYEEVGKEYTSDSVIIKCFSAPDFELNIYSDSQQYTLKNTILNIGVNYSQAENEELNFYYLVVTDASNNVIYQSENVYNEDKYVQVNDLEDNSNYSVCGYGETVNGMIIETSKINVTTSFVKNETFTMLKASNNERNACVDIDAKIKNILYRLENPNEVYDDTFTSIDLTNNVLEYYDGFSLYNNFSLYLEYVSNAQKSVVLDLNDGEIVLVYGRGEENFSYFEFRYNGKILIIDKDKDGNSFTTNNNVFEIIIYRNDDEIQIDIKNKL